MSSDDDHPPSAVRTRARRPQRQASTGRLRVRLSDEWGAPLAGGGVTRWLSRIAPARARGDVNIALVRDATSRALNRRYRGRDVATDVLSFPASPGPDVSESPLLGDIVIAAGVARRQARAAGHREFVELRVLALHGLLHLLGYDHEQAHDNGRMARVEARLRRKGGLRAGLIERQV